MHFFKERKKLLFVLVLFLTFFLGLSIPTLKHVLHSKDKSFERYTEQLFRTQITGSALDLHYTLANPQNYGITSYPVSLGHIISDDTAYNTTIENLNSSLQKFPKKYLSERNQLTWNILNNYAQTERSAASLFYMSEPMSPLLGVQAQLPILFAEYTFRSKQDIDQYISLIKDLPDYFQELIAFEKCKAKQGLFMGKDSALNVIAECQTFTTDSDNHYLQAVFEEKIKAATFLSEDEKTAYLDDHRALIKDYVIPAYHFLKDETALLIPSGKNPYGLAYFSDGKAYYEYLVKSTVGCYDSIETIRRRMISQLSSDYEQIRKILAQHPAYLSSSDSSIAVDKDPVEILSHLQEIMQSDFPDFGKADYTVKSVDPSLEEYLSPAFYLTPPIDDFSANTIYINDADSMSSLELFTTLAHEGFPGHLYQTTSFYKTRPASIRSLISCGGYVEGWATYVESYAYEYASADDPEYGHLQWLNRSINLCLCSLLDIGIHYYGWTPTQAFEFLSKFGTADEQQTKELYQNILENPANYLKYYLGYLCFTDLREEQKTQKGNDFNLVEFHKKVLTLGPAPFSILREYL